MLPGDLWYGGLGALGDLKVSFRQRIQHNVRLYSWDMAYWDSLLSFAFLQLIASYLDSHMSPIFHPRSLAFDAILLF
jgi:hypothetical protein